MDNFFLCNYVFMRKREICTCNCIVSGEETQIRQTRQLSILCTWTKNVLKFQLEFPSKYYSLPYFLNSFLSCGQHSLIPSYTTPFATLTCSFILSSFIESLLYTIHLPVYNDTGPNERLPLTSRSPWLHIL